MVRVLGICMIALAATFVIACGDDDGDESASPGISIEAPGAATTTPTAPPTEATETAPPTETAPSGARPGKSSKRKGEKVPAPGGGETADLPKCDEIGGGPAPCRRGDGSVKVPERL